MTKIAVSLINTFQDIKLQREQLLHWLKTNVPDTSPTIKVFTLNNYAGSTKTIIDTYSKTNL